jgi:5-methyltetrahydropteroyltriglutamate--homocysteine methyltransferase
MTTRDRADQVGSLLRPPELLRARADYAAGRLGPDELGRAEDRAILAALALQRQAGLDIFTDGEYRRGAFLTDLAEAVEGFVPQKVLIEWRGPGGGPAESYSQVVGGRLRQTRRLTAHQVAFLKAHAPGPFKITMPNPALFMFAAYKPGLTDRFYPTRPDLMNDLVGIIRGEIQALRDEGVPYIQLDAPQYSFYVDPRTRDRIRQAGVDPDRAFEEAVSGDVACLEGMTREGVSLAMHVCRGNYRSLWYAEGGYEPIAEKLFGSIPVDRFLLEYDTDRAGGFEPLRFMPRGKTVVLGLVSTKEPRLESQDDLLRRIEEASRYVPAERLALSPQCGFASGAEGNLLSMDDQRRKLELVADTARKVWG